MADVHPIASGLLGRRAPIVPIIPDHETRARIHEEIRHCLDRATMLLDFLNAVDEPLMDMEPSLGWEGSATTGSGPYSPYHQLDLSAGLSPIGAEGDEAEREATAQPITLAPNVSPVQVVRPSRRQMRAAYRAAGEAVPVNLRGVLGRLWS